MSSKLILTVADVQQLMIARIKRDFGTQKAYALHLGLSEQSISDMKSDNPRRKTSRGISPKVLVDLKLRVVKTTTKHYELME